MQKSVAHGQRFSGFWGPASFGVGLTAEKTAVAGVLATIVLVSVGMVTVMAVTAVVDVTAAVVAMTRFEKESASLFQEGNRNRSHHDENQQANAENGEKGCHHAYQTPYE
jgi:hypothetical protein